MENIAKFRFDGYTIVKSLIEIKDPNQASEELSVDFDLLGTARHAERTFELTMKVVVSDKGKNLNSEVVAIGKYSFDDDCEGNQLGGFFNMNAPAILFPYLRAHIATLSTLCGLDRPIMLPTLNVSGLEQQLAENTKSE